MGKCLLQNHGGAVSACMPTRTITMRATGQRRCGCSRRSGTTGRGRRRKASALRICLCSEPAFGDARSPRRNGAEFGAATPGGLRGAGIRNYCAALRGALGPTRVRSCDREWDPPNLRRAPSIPNSAYEILELEERPITICDMPNRGNAERFENSLNV